jgi:SAM-dependent methyltransferase
VSTAAFTGEIPEAYERLLVPVMFAPYAREIARRVALGGPARVLEVACGTGALTRELRHALPSFTPLVATDLNEAMVARAREAGTDGVAWATADAAALPFDDAEFDAVACGFGLMFLPDRVAGLAEAERVLRPGGTLVASVWRPLAEHPAHAAVADGLAEAFPDDPPRFLDTPYGYHDRAALRRDADAAGFGALDLDDVRHVGEAASARAFVEGILRGTPLAHDVEARGADLDGLAAALAARVAARCGDAPCRVPLAATIVTARAGSGTPPRAPRPRP